MSARKVGVSARMNSDFADSLLKSHRWLDEEGHLREPDREGPAGRAWLLQPEDAIGSIGMWLVNRPEAHPWWEWWTVTIVHLRDDERLPAPHKTYPEAQYEFQIRTIDPDEHPTPDPDLCDEGYEHLEPPDVIEQFHGLSDSQAQQLCSEAIQSIVSGEVSPDENFRDQWHELIRQKVEEIVANRLLFN